MPFMSVIFEGLRGGARQPMLILIAPVFWLSGLRRTSWSPQRQLNEDAAQRPTGAEIEFMCEPNECRLKAIPQASTS